MPIAYRGGSDALHRLPASTGEAAQARQRALAAVLDRGHGLRGEQGADLAGEAGIQLARLGAEQAQVGVEQLEESLRFRHVVVGAGSIEL